jgi:hypothetical protein
MVRARRAALKWAEPTAMGDGADDVRSDSRAEALRASLPPSTGWSTVRTPAFLRWRYGFRHLNYRAVEVGDGLAIFRVRERGMSREVALCEWLSPTRRARDVARLTRAGDYVVGIRLGLASGMVPAPRLGPIVTWRTLARSDVPRLADLHFALGDLELF